jgi:hypothetical protein
MKAQLLRTIGIKRATSPTLSDLTARRRRCGRNETGMQAVNYFAHGKTVYNFADCRVTRKARGHVHGNARSKLVPDGFE